MQVFRHLVHIVLVAQLSLLQPLAAWGTPKTAEEKKTVMIEAALELVASNFMLVRTLNDFDRQYLRYMRPDDRKEILSAIHTIKKMPRMYRRGSMLIVDDGLNKTQIKMISLIPMQLEVDGVAFTYDPSKNLVAQLNAQKPRSHSLYNFLIPEAEAEWVWKVLVFLTITAVGSAANAAGPIGDLVLAASCKSAPWLKSCLDLQKAQRTAYLAKAPKFDAVFNQSAIDKKNLQTKFIVEDQVCPSENDGKPREYRGRIRQAEMVSGKQVPIGPWIEVDLQLDPKGVPQDFIFSAAGTDPKTLDATSVAGAKNLVAHIVFDPTELKPLNYRLPNPEYGEKNSLASPTKVIDRTMKNSSAETQDLDMLDEMIVRLNGQNYSCVVAKVTEEQAIGIDPGSPAEPKKVDDSGAKK
jgi:hypothetical protein